ncbi:MAG: restriction endonuclease [Caldicoprobacterales bacterium]
MSLWLFRAGKTGEYEEKFLGDNKVYLTWEGFDVNLNDIDSQEGLYEILMEKFNLENEKTAINWASQIWAMAHKIQIGDWVVLPSKRDRTLHFGKVRGNYVFDKSLGSPYYHYREVHWFAKDIPRDRFDQDILYSLGAAMTICRIHRNKAEERIKEMAKNNWYVKAKPIARAMDDVDEETGIDLDEYISDQISERIIQKFKGHRMEELINEILKAKGFTTYRSPEGADHGVDILASPGVLGFGSPKICVQVKTEANPIGRPILDQLIGAMSNFNADYGLLVSWSGFKSSVMNEASKQFFKVRLWNSQNIIQEIFNNYEKLSNEIKAEIPLKRIWMLNIEEE